MKGLHQLATGLPAEPEAIAKKAITYLENQRPWIGSYEHWRKLGYHTVPSFVFLQKEDAFLRLKEMIEQAVSLVVNRRMRNAGHALVSSQCYRYGRFAHGSAQ